MAFVKIRWGDCFNSWAYAAPLRGAWIAGLCGRPRLPALTFGTRADAVAAAERLAALHRYPTDSELTAAPWPGWCSVRGNV